jgi:1,4-dihydroxy-2-naphthoyl-CoA synthase
MEYKDIIFERKAGIARITINRPQRYNACTQETVHELIDAFNQCMDEEIGVVVFTGAGDKAFISDSCASSDRTGTPRDKDTACPTLSNFILSVYI